MSNLDLLAAGLSAVVGVEVVLPNRGAKLPNITVHNLFHHTYIMRPLEKVNPGELFDIIINDFTMTGTIVTIQVTNDFTVTEVKAAVERKDRTIQIRQTRLIFCGKQLEDDKTLGSYWITSGSTIFLVHRLRGGGYDFELRTDVDELSPGYDYDFTKERDDGKTYRRGGFEYRRPYGWMRFAIKALGRYGNDDWLGPNGIRTEESPGEWPVSYHGTNIGSANAILENGYKAGDRALYGDGVYSSPSLEMVERLYAQDFTHEGKSYKIVFQNRTNPDQSKGHLKIIPANKTGAGADYWLSSKQDPENNVFDVRPYGILIRKV